uniref:DUF2027 domain-containing protein n=1 Tax=Prevotella sp. GTC17253 TaxID=3236793 RepID=A0AB33IRM3_9BACT
MKIGDKVRFLNDISGGTIAGFQGHDIVLVEDEDGFQIPVSKADIVVTNMDDYSTAKAIKLKTKALEKKQKQEQEGEYEYHSIKALLHDEEDVDTTDDDDLAEEREITFKQPIEEREGGDLLNLYLAFVPKDKLSITQTSFKVYLVNDCNYYVQCAYASCQENNYNLRFQGEIAPNTQILIEELERETINDISRISLQAFFFKRDKTYIGKPSFDIRQKIDPVKFYKSHTFIENDFFDSPALLYHLIHDDEPLTMPTVKTTNSPEVVGNKDSHDTARQNKRFISKKDADIVVVDLHAHELLDTTAGMKPEDIRNYQMEKFNEIMNHYKNRQGQKIVFIHGKGNGVLRQSILHELNYKYKKVQYQDASFLEYGYGATQVIIK